MKNIKNHVKKQISRNNPWYTDSQFTWAQKEEVKRIYIKRHDFFEKIIKKVGVKNKLVKILDYGCGDGYWSLNFSEYDFCEVTGVDYNHLRIKRAKEYASKAKFIEADLVKEQDALGRYDILFCSQIIEHIENDVHFLKNLKRYLCEDGILLIGTPNEGCWTQQFRNKRVKEETDHVHFYKEKEICSKLEEVGFVIKQRYREVFFPLFDKVYYNLTSSDIGFKFLEALTQICPSQCSGYYFECVLK